MKEEKYDVAVIGMGSAGKGAAALLKEAGLRVVCFDDGGPGNLCSREGCMPSKTFFAAVEHVYQMNKFSDLTKEKSTVEIDFDRLMDYVRKLTATEFVHYVELARQKVGFIKGRAEVIDAHTVSCEGENYSVDFIIVATGSRPYIPMVKGLVDTPFWTSREVFQLDSSKIKGKSLAVLGGGVIACEMAQCFRKMGFEVAIHTRSDVILREFDQRQISELRDIYTQELGVSFIEGLPEEISYNETSNTFIFSTGECYSHQ